MSDLGSALSLAGVIVALWGFIWEHHARQLPHLWPWAVLAWARFRAWIGKPIPPVEGSMNAVLQGVSAQAYGLALPPRPEATDFAAMDLWLDEKIDSKIRVLRVQVGDEQADTRAAVSAVESQLQGLRSDLGVQDRKSERLNVAAMRWQIGGLTLAMIGSLLSLVSAVFG